MRRISDLRIDSDFNFTNNCDALCRKFFPRRGISSNLRFVDSPSPPPAAHPSPLEHFRARLKRLPLHPQENLLLWIISSHLVCLPWALGAMRWWAQVGSFVFAVIGFLVAIRSRSYTEEYTTASANFRLFTLPKLWRFPIFWAGLALLVYVLIQALNPAWTYVEKDRRWWMLAVPHITWLPSGTRNPFILGGPWRILLVYSSAWLVVCSIWIGFTRRRTVQLFFTVLAVNGVVLAAFALAQRLTAHGLMFWFWKSPAGAMSFASFVYKNHAGAYLLLTLAVNCALAAWFYLRGLRRMEKSNPGGLFVFFGVLIAVAIVVSYARGATIATLAFLVIAILAFLLFQFRRPDLLRRPVVTFVLLLGLGFFLRIALGALSAGEAWDRMNQLVNDQGNSIHSRWVATQASWEMVKANWEFGTGAGSFQFLFPAYQRHFPDIYMPEGRRLFWDHAHNDFMEISAELGLFGVVVIAFCFAFWWLQLARNYFWDNPLSLLLAAGCLTVFIHAWTDLLFQSPAILITWCALWPALIQWTQSEEMKLRS